MWSGPDQEGCEVIEISSGDGADCDQTDYGCCPDGQTPAKGPSDAGCDDTAETVSPGEGRDNTDIDIDVPGRCKICSQKKK